MDANAGDDAGAAPAAPLEPTPLSTIPCAECARLNAAVAAMQADTVKLEATLESALDAEANSRAERDSAVRNLNALAISIEQAQAAGAALPPVPVVAPGAVPAAAPAAAPAAVVNAVPSMAERLVAWPGRVKGAQFDAYYALRGNA